jgi:flagellar hook assembly protein FlgD
VKVTANDLPVAKINVGADQVKFYPNPFTDRLTIEISLTEPKNLEVKIYDLSGKLVRSLCNRKAGTSETLFWDGTNSQGTKVITGIYLLKTNEMIEKIAVKK